LVSEFLLGISETLHCSMFVPQLKVVPLLDVQQLLMLFAGRLTYSESGTFSLNIFKNSIIVNIISIINIDYHILCSFFFSLFVLALKLTSVLLS
jgi:hypothetical protein